MSMTKADFLALLAPATAPVTLVNGQTVWVREIPAGDAEKIGPALNACTTERDRQCVAAMAYLSNEEGEQVLSADNPDDLAAVGRLGFANLRRILAAGDKINGYGTDAEKKT